MAIFHSHLSIVQRSKGQSSVKSSAYQSAEKIIDERTGEINDYTKKQGVVFSEVITPENTPDTLKDRKVLWNEVEKVEKNNNSQLARKIEFSLPKELSKEQQIQLLKEYVKDNFISKGMIADVNIYDIGKGNPHAHIQLTMRPLDKDGNFNKCKSRKVYCLDESGNKIKLPSGNYKTYKENLTDWDKKENANLWRKNLSDKINEYLEKNKINQKIDHRSYKEQGIEKIPCSLSMAVYQMEQKGIKTIKGDQVREIKEYNNNIIKIKDLQKQKLEIEKSINNEKEIKPEKDKNFIHLELTKNNVELVKKIFDKNNIPYDIKQSEDIFILKYNIENEQRFKFAVINEMSKENKYKNYENEIKELNNKHDEKLEECQPIYLKVHNIDSQIFNLKHYEYLIKDNNDYIQFHTERLNNLKGLFKGKERKEIQNNINKFEKFKQDNFNELNKQFNTNIKNDNELDTKIIDLQRLKKPYEIKLNEYRKELEEINNQKLQFKKEYQKELIKDFLKSKDDYTKSNIKDKIDSMKISDREFNELTKDIDLTRQDKEILRGDDELEKERSERER